MPQSYTKNVELSISRPPNSQKDTEERTLVVKLALSGNLDASCRSESYALGVGIRIDHSGLFDPNSDSDPDPKMSKTGFHET